VAAAAGEDVGDEMFERDGLRLIGREQWALALKNLMEDCGDLVETVLQWISKPTPTARAIDREMGNAGPVPGGGGRHAHLSPLQRPVHGRRVREGGPRRGEAMDAAYLATMQEMDTPQNLDRLVRLGTAVAERQVDAAHFPEAFDAGVSVG
jgi:hypothetical protein